MVPAVFVQLNEMPLTPNGKIDRLSLPVCEDKGQFHEYIALRNETEQILVDIWKNVLEIKQVGIHDNFFDLGGGSIQSLQVVAAARLAGIHITPESIFEYQTIEQLAEKIRREELN